MNSVTFCLSPSLRVTFGRSPLCHSPLSLDGSLLAIIPCGFLSKELPGARRAGVQGRSSPEVGDLGAGLMEGVALAHVDELPSLTLLT